MMFASYRQDWISWDYILGDPIADMSIAVARYNHLRKLANKNHDLKIAIKDPASGAWTKWVQFYPKGKDNTFSLDELQTAYDIHRNVLDNEIVIESDYPTYEENYKACRVLGAILEHKGLIPLYYYSGNKSIHVHIYFDFNCLNKIDKFLIKELIEIFRGSMARFKKKFMEWLRKRMITCWGTKARQFDEDLIKASHLIRCELSRNKQGFKTFLGYTYKDVSFIPYLCNEGNRIYPVLGKLVLSSPHYPQELIEEFLQDLKLKKSKAKTKRKEAYLSKWITGEDPADMRKEVKFIMSDKFKEGKDGYKRGMFILCNELKRQFDPATVIIMVKDWNQRMGAPLRDQQIEYRANMKTYNLSTEYVRDFLSSIGFKEIL